jgi:VanZ family protein
MNGAGTELRTRFSTACEPAQMPPFLVPFVFDARYRRLEFRCAFVLYFAVLVLGSIPGARADVGELASGLVLHTLTYCCIALLLFGGITGSAWRKAVLTFLIVAAMGAFDEYVQSFFPYRMASVIDWLVDLNAGFVTSALLWRIWPEENSQYSRPRL